MQPRRCGWAGRCCARIGASRGSTWRRGRTVASKAETLDQYWTRRALAKAVVEWANIQPGERIAEPSCGAGDLVRWMPEHAGEILAMDIDSKAIAAWPDELMNRPRLEVVGGDWLKYRGPRNAFDK